MKTLQLIIIFLSLSIHLSAQLAADKSVKGKGKCYYSTLQDEDNARNKAVYNAQKNALVNFGGSINISNETYTSNINQKESSPKTKASFSNINTYLSKSQMNFQGIVTPIGEYIETKGKDAGMYFIEIEGVFTVVPEPYGVIANEIFLQTNDKITIRLDLRSGKDYYPSIKTGDYADSWGGRESKVIEYDAKSAKFREIMNTPFSNFEFWDRDIFYEKKLLLLKQEKMVDFSIKCYDDRKYIDIYIKGYKGVYKTITFESNIFGNYEDVWKRIKQVVYGTIVR
jgi:hypothetical protein